MPSWSLAQLCCAHDPVAPPPSGSHVKRGSLLSGLPEQFGLFQLAVNATSAGMLPECVPCSPQWCMCDPTPSPLLWHIKCSGEFDSTCKQFDESHAAAELQPENFCSVP